MKKNASFFFFRIVYLIFFMEKKASFLEEYLGYQELADENKAFSFI